MIRQFLPDMIERNEGHIVAISSVTALSPSDSYSLYAATKSGVLSTHKIFILLSSKKKPKLI